LFIIKESWADNAQAYSQEGYDERFKHLLTKKVLLKFGITELNIYLCTVD
jgi:hypothetical protein